MADQRSLFDAAPMGRGVRRSAVVSPCGAYRYSLTRTWDDDLCPTAFVMLNPSTADAAVDDPTIRKCMGFARRWGAGGIIVVNLFAFRATDPADLVAARSRGVDIRGPERDYWIAEALAMTDVVVCAWGAHSFAVAEGLAVTAAIPATHEVVCLGCARNNQPRHPLMLGYSTKREAYR